MFDKILIANRGEIACRIIATARAMGVRTVAVYSDADRDARHVALADEARRIGPPPARKSYLDIEALLAAARATGAEAIHPGYGFLSESEQFARACAAAGIVFIGPTPEAIAAMGDKAAAKRLMENAGVPLVPGYHGGRQDSAFLAEQAAKLGYPVLVKAAAAGGGKGMRVVRDAASFGAALDSARREAKAAFGDDRVLLEKYLERSRHIEVQVFGDRHGNLVHLFERDCSVQRRHQKVLEEAPAPGLSPARRSEIAGAALAAAKAIRYVGAGTVEFIAGADGAFYFMEMNTRLQVEHPVTELITGLDLVSWQLAIAAGDPIPLQQDEIQMKGHAIEARIYAENPDKGFLPSTGTLRHVRFSAQPARVDSGVRQGDVVTPHYDPMLAKLIVWGEDRATALARMRAALAQCEIIGVATNVEFLGRVAASKAFASADLDTGLIERCAAELFPAERPASDEELAAAAFAELGAEQAQAATRAQASGDPHSPWSRVDGWRLNLGSHHEIAFKDGDAIRRVQIHFLPEGLRLAVDGNEVKNTACGVRTVRDGGDWHLFRDGAHRVLAVHDEHSAAGDDEVAGSLAAPMPGRILQVLVQPGAQVARGAPLLILEAMKMEHTITAPHEGRVRRIFFKAGEQVAEGADLLELEAA
ncbi:MAG: acetyl-CoA carboxylase biotin carboxylase subunit [Betaproteobacteria bacterium]|nr:acetyl-CoA carboxylase biotin carboxylase subunit [Betaproteobacteria bacterium]